MSFRLKTAGTVLGLVAAAMLVARVMSTRSSVSVYYAGGTADAPVVLAKHFEKGTTSRSSGTWETLTYTTGSPDPSGSLTTNANPAVYGGKGSKVWLNVIPMPLLFDANRAVVDLNARMLEDEHPQLANGFEVYHPPHPGFDGPVHLGTGALAVVAKNELKYVIDPGGTLHPWSDFVAEYPAVKPEICKGVRVCGSICVELKPDSGGGQTLVFEGGQTSEAMFNPEIVAYQGCTPKISHGGPVVVAHQSQAGRDRIKNELTAMSLEGETLWSTTLEELFPDLDIESHLVSAVDGLVVAGAVVPHWWYGSRVAVATIAADGTVTPAV